MIIIKPDIPYFQLFFVINKNEAVFVLSYEISLSLSVGLVQFYQ